MITKSLKYICAISVVCGLASCDDQIMEWSTPEGHGAVTKAELPLEVKEVLANYDNLKAYAPDGFILGLGFGAPLYTSDDARRQLADDNFQMLTWGNAMKHDAMVGNTGTLSANGLAQLDAALDAMPEGMLLYGHNFFWHTQQNQTFLKSLIKPTLVVESDSDIKNQLAGDASDFDGGSSGGWGSWGSGKVSADVVEGAGPDGSPAMVLVSNDGSFWQAQFAYTFDDYLQPDAEYTIRFKAKSSTASGQLQFQYQNGSTYGSQGGYTTFDVGTSWTTCEAKFTITDYDDVNRIIINFGQVGGTYTIDNIEFGFQEDNPLNLLLSTDFESGESEGWGSWGSNKEDGAVVDGEGVGKSKALMLKSAADGSFWQAQCAYTFDEFLSPDAEYTIRFKARSVSGKGQLQFQYQNGSTYGSQGAYTTFDVASSWTQCEATFTPAFDDVNRIIINFGQVGDTYYIDDIEFGTAKATDPMDNILAGDDSDFEGGTNGGWGSWGSNKESADVVAEAAHSGSYGLKLVAAADGSFWQAQCAYTFDDPLQPNSKYIIQFYAKSSSAAGQLQFQYQNSTTYQSQGGYTTFDVGTDWTLCQAEFTITDYDDVNRIIINFGQVGATYYIDDIKFGLAKDQGASEARPRRAAKSYYVLKSAEEKAAALEEAMESWISQMAAHLKEKGVTPYAYDVINEAIADGSNKVRGVDNVFGSSDSAPTESTEDGLNLNWADNHFYWGYYVKDYGVKAFQLARKYFPDTKLFINDYNLETSPSKLTALIAWVKSIDEANGAAIVDGIGTQMHVAINPTDDADNNAAIVARVKAQADEQFQTMAATGKLVRVTELDIDMCSYDANGERSATTNPSATQYQCQAEVYRVIFESYLANVPAAQRSGITIWSLTDNADEHEYWLKDGKPNLFDESNLRKWAFKGAADGLAGEDLGLKYGGEDYKAYYERQNVSSTVQ